MANFPKTHKINSKKMIQEKLFILKSILKLKFLGQKLLCKVLVLIFSTLFHCFYFCFPALLIFYVVQVYCFDNKNTSQVDQKYFLLVLTTVFSGQGCVRRLVVDTTFCTPLRLRLPFPNDAQTLRRKASLEPNQISN